MFKFLTPTVTLGKRKFVALLAKGLTVMIATIFLSSATYAQYCNIYYVQSGGTGSGTPTSPGSLTSALATLSSGGTILMEAGTYSFTSTLVIPANVIIDGGYTSGAAWVKSNSTPTIINIVPALQTGVTEGNTVGFYVGVVPGNNVQLKDLTINTLPGGASGTYNGYGLSIYGVYLNSVTGVLLSRCVITTGTASGGISGGTPAGTGGAGVGGGGGGGSGNTGGYGGGCGGNGGNGSAPPVTNWGSDAGGAGGGGCCSSGENTAGCGSNGCSAGFGASGSSGASAPPFAGTPNNSPGSADPYYAPVNGSQGYSGDGGGGGGGGGAGAYGTCCSCFTECGSESLNGGNGGQGGNGGLGGYGGYGGGGTFAIWGYGGVLATVVDCQLSPGSGGAGGAGGAGQAGSGGAGGTAGLQNGGCRAGSGGNGGTGGTGGTGGVGQQGATGASLTYYNSNGSSISISGATSVPTDGTLSANWVPGCTNSQITLSKTTTDLWGSFIGTDAQYIDNLTATTSTYNSSSSTAVIYYPNTSNTGNKTVVTGTTNFSNYIILKGNNRDVTPTTGIISAISSPCPHDNISLTNTLNGTQAGNIIGYQWQVSLVSNPTNILYTSTAANPGSIPPPSGGWVPGGVYQVRLELDEACCGWSIPIWSGFTVNSGTAPAVTIAASATTICAGVGVQFTATPTSEGGTSPSYQWIKNGNNVGTNSNTYTDYGLNNGDVVHVVMTSSASCAVPATATSNSITITVDPIPTVNISTNSAPTTFCQGGSVLLTANGSNNPTYQWNNGATTASINVTQGGGYIVTVATGVNCTALASIIVTVNPLPSTTVTANGPTTFCLGGSVQLQAPSNVSYSWSTGATSQSISASATGVYSVTATSCGGCTAASTGTLVTVNTLPDATLSINGPTTFCQGGNVTLTAPPNTSYSWSDGETTQEIIVSTSGNYSVTVANGNNCTASSGVTTITVNPVPASTITASGPTSFCQNGSVTLTASPGASYYWNEGQTTQSIVVTSSGNYGVLVANATGCGSISAFTTVTVNPSPTANISVGGNTTFCQGDSVNISASGGSSYLWSDGETIQNIFAKVSGVYDVTVTNSYNCTAASGSVSVIVNPLPNANLTPSGSLTICAGSSVSITADEFGSATQVTYSWSNGTSGQSINVTKAGIYNVTITSTSGCTAVASDTVIVSPLPAATITASGPLSFCPGGSVTLTAKAGTGYSYSWSTGQLSQAITVTTAGTYNVTVSNAAGCEKVSVNKKVAIYAVPTAKITVSKANTVCSEGQATLTAAKATGGTYDWSTGATTQAIVIHNPGTYDVTVTNSHACSASNSEDITCGATVEVADKTNDNSNTSTGSSTIDNSFDISVYPNPYAGTFHLKVISSSNANMNIKIFDVNGKLIEERPDVSYGPDVLLGDGYASGFYIVQVQQGQSSKQLRVIKLD